MKLATACYGFRQWSIEDYLYGAAGLGIKHVEIGYTNHLSGTLQHLLNIHKNVADIDNVAWVRVLAEEAGVNLASAVRHYQMWGLNDTWMEATKANVRLDIELAASVGIKVLRVTEIGYPHDWNEEQVFDEIVEVGKLLNELAAHAEQHDVTIVTENFRASSDLMLAITSHFTSPNVGLHYDPHNFCRAGEDPTEALRKIKDHVKYVHLKDYRMEDGQKLPTDTWWPSWAVGDGEIDWRSVLAELGTFYNGVMAIEYEKNLHDVLMGMKKSVDFVRQVAAEINVPLH